MEYDMDFYDALEFLPLEGEQVFVLGLFGLWEAIVHDNGLGEQWCWWQEGYTELCSEYTLWSEPPTELLQK